MGTQRLAHHYHHKNTNDMRRSINTQRHNIVDYIKMDSLFFFRTCKPAAESQTFTLNVSKSRHCVCIIIKNNNRPEQ